jgi:hypothetical protein
MVRSWRFLPVTPYARFQVFFARTVADGEFGCLTKLMGGAKRKIRTTRSGRGRPKNKPCRRSRTWRSSRRREGAWVWRLVPTATYNFFASYLAKIGKISHNSRNSQKTRARLATRAWADKANGEEKILIWNRL